MLLAFLGLSLGMDNRLSMIVILLPITAALLYRIKVEEETLSLALGRNAWSTASAPVA